MSEDFLPTDYKMSTGSDKYMKFAQGDNKFRILSSAITGVLFWVEEGGKRKPVRIHIGGVAPFGFVDDPKEFWAFVVWNYQEEKVQILELTQKKVQKPIMALSRDESWGNPKKYDIVVNKKGTTKEDTDYQVFPKPPTAIDEGIVKMYEYMNINLAALYEGKDPFGDDTTAAKVADEVDMGTKQNKKVEAPF